MNKKIIVLAIITILATMLFSGCNEQQSIQTEKSSGLTVGSKDSFSVDSNGGDFSVLDDAVKVNIKAGTVSEQVNIT